MDRYNFNLIESKWQKFWDENKSFKNGPLVCPGKYKAVLSLGEKKLVTEFIIRKDPKLSVSNPY